MKQFKSRYSDLRQTLETFQAKHIEEPFDAREPNVDARSVQKDMLDRDFDVMGIERDGIICGYVKQEDLSEGKCGDYIQQFKIDEIISDSTP